MSTIWIVSLAFAWVVIALLTGCIVTLMAQVGELRARLDGGGAPVASAPPVGPQLYDPVERVELPVLARGATTIAVGGEQERPAVVVFHAPGCSSCANIEQSLELLSIERPDVLVVGAVALERASAVRHVAAHPDRRVTSVAAEDVPRQLMPEELPALVAIAREGAVAAVGAPDVIEHLREAADVAAGAVLIAGPDSVREMSWGLAVPTWGAHGPAELDVLHVEGGPGQS